MRGFFAGLKRRQGLACPASAPSLPGQVEIEITDRAALVACLTSFTTGHLHSRRVTIRVTGPFSQTVSKAYSALYKLRAVRRRGEMRSLSGAIALLAKDDPTAMLQNLVKEHGDALYIDDQARSALCLPSADLICLMMLAGLGLHFNDSDMVIISDGDRTPGAIP